LSRRLHAFDQPFRLRFGFMAGIDEAGRGPLAGPVVAAAVILPFQYRLPGLNDSKQLTPSRRERLYAAIQRQALSIGVGVISPDDIDRINIRQASFAAMRLALEGLLWAPDHVLVDGFAIPGWPGAQTAVVRGDARSASIAAASIVAKVTRDAIMRRYHREFPEYGFDRHKGYGTAEHLEVILHRGPCPIHRRSFAPLRIARG
jgi:ribonuclease HII